MNGLLYSIGLTLLPGIGSVTARSLVAYCGSPEAVFREKRSKLEKIPGIGPQTAHVITHPEIIQDALQRAEKEIRFMEKNGIRAVFFTDPDYPFRLKQCEDAPVLLFSRGNTDLKADRMIAVVGSRKSTDYGHRVCEELIEALSGYGITVVSGLAYGIDIVAHRTALQYGLATIGVVAHGLDLVYPAEHRKTAEKMEEKGGLLTEFLSRTKMNPEYFPRRNRIVAGMTQATLVVEAHYKSGALITAEIANSYDREVFSVPGRIGDESSEGCNLLIRANKAMLIQSADDIAKSLGWDQPAQPLIHRQADLFTGLNAEEEALVKVLKGAEKVHIDDLCSAADLPMSRASGILLNLEFSGKVRSLPGKMYSLK